MTATYKPVAGFPHYRVGDDGSVWSNHPLRRSEAPRDWTRLSPAAKESGHLILCLRRNVKRHMVFVHRLVIEAFVGPPPSGMECLHGDGNPANNNIDNLRWGTRKENIADSEKHGTKRIGENHHCAKLSDAEVAEIRDLCDQRRKKLPGSMTYREIATRYHVTKNYVTMIANNYVRTLPGVM